MTNPVLDSVALVPDMYAPSVDEMGNYVDGVLTIGCGLVCEGG